MATMSDLRRPYDLNHYRPPTPLPNPYALDALAEDGLSLDTWHLPDARHIDIENPTVHLAHVTGCEDTGAEFVVSWCAVAFDEDAQRATGSDPFDVREMCAACVGAIRPGDRCPVCTKGLDDLV